MAAPKGNQYAKGCKTSGRPRVYDYEEEAQALLEWSKKDDSFTLYGFTTERGYPAERLSEWAKVCDELSQALRLAKEAISNRLITGAVTKKYSDSAAMKVLPLYSKEYKADRDEQKKKAEETKVSVMAQALKYVSESKDDS